MVLLAHLVEAFDGLRLAGDIEILALGKQQLLIDQVAEQVALLLIELLLGPLLLLRLVFEILLGTLEVRPADDLVVHARNNILDHRSLVWRLLRRWGGRFGGLAEGGGYSCYRQAGCESGS